MIKIEEIYGENYHFITEYPENKYIEKTIAYACKMSLDRQLIKMGRMEVYLRNGETYSFESWVTGSYCAQYGIQVSEDGRFIYVISDEKGLWCYTYKGELVWKTRYTSVSYVIPHPNHHITCVTTTKLLILDSNGKIIKQVPIYREGWCEPASERMLVANTSETIIALFDSFSLDMLYKISIKKLGLKSFFAADLSGDILTVKGRSFNCNGSIVTVKVDLKNDVSIV